MCKESNCILKTLIDNMPGHSVYIHQTSFSQPPMCKSISMQHCTDVVDYIKNIDLWLSGLIYPVHVQKRSGVPRGITLDASRHVKKQRSASTQTTSAPEKKAVTQTQTSSWFMVSADELITKYWFKDTFHLFSGYRGDPLHSGCETVQAPRRRCTHVRVITKED